MQGIINIFLTTSVARENVIRGGKSRRAKTDYFVVADPLRGTDFSASSIVGYDVGVDGEDPKMVSSSVGATENGGGGGESDSLASKRNIRWSDFRFSNFEAAVAVAAGDSVFNDSALSTLDGG